MFSLLLLGCTALAGCASPTPCHERGIQPDSLRSIHVVRRGWHTGIVVAVADWPNQGWSVLEDFKGVDYMEFGWGDKAFYQSDENSVWLGSRAALWPTDSVIHVVGLREPLAEPALANEIVEVSVASEGLAQLASSIEHAFAEKEPTANAATRTTAPAPNRFYEAKGKFFFPRMCNWWTAARLEEAGCPIEPWAMIAASQIMQKARAFAGHDDAGRPPGG